MMRKVERKNMKRTKKLIAMKKRERDNHLIGRRPTLRAAKKLSGHP